MNLKRATKAAIALAWWSGGRVAALLRPNRNSLTILYYHAVRPDEADRFAQQLDAIRAYAEVVRPDYIGEPDGRPRAAVTFDDAFVSVIDNALPALDARGMSATIFVPTQCLGAPPNWAMEHGATDRREMIATAEAVRDLDRRGVILGAHSQTHPRLSAVDADRAAQELSGSKADLEALTGKPVAMFAFPYGDFSDAVVAEARQAGYRFVFSTQPARVDPASEDILRPRVAVDLSDTALEFWLKLRGGYAWMLFASSLKRRLGA